MTGSAQVGRYVYNRPVSFQVLSVCDVPPDKMVTVWIRWLRFCASCNLYRFLSNCINLTLIIINFNMYNSVVQVGFI